MPDRPLLPATLALTSWRPTSHPPLQVPSDWLASVSITPVSLGEGRCTGDPTGSKALLLPGDSRLA